MVFLSTYLKSIKIFRHLKVSHHNRVIPYFLFHMINYLINDIAASSAMIVTSGWNLKIDPGTSGVTDP